MLDRTGNADGDIKVGRDNLAGLANLIVVRHKAGIDSGTRRTNGCTKLVGDFLQHREVCTVLHAAATRDDDWRAGQFRTLGAGQFRLHIA